MPGEAAPRRPRGSAGIGRAAALLVVAVVAAALVLTMGALRAGPRPSGSALATSSGDLASLAPTPRPTVRATPTVTGTPPPPEPTALPELRGEFVGALGRVESCPVLYPRRGVLGLILPDGYRTRVRAGRLQLIDPAGTVSAVEGDLLGLDGKVREGGASCMVGPQLHVSRIVEVRSRGS